MVLPIGGFMPIPLAMMIPFMFLQSVMMGYGFGTGYQYSKRKVSAMSNAEFNRTSLQQLTSELFGIYKEIIPDLKNSIRESTGLQNFVVASLLDMPRDLLSNLFGGSSEQAGHQHDETLHAHGPTGPSVTVDYEATGIPEWLAAYGETSTFGTSGDIPPLYSSGAEEETNRFNKWAYTIQFMNLTQVSLHRKEIRNNKFPWSSKMTTIAKKALDTRMQILIKEKRETGNVLGPSDKPTIEASTATKQINRHMEYKAEQFNLIVKAYKSMMNSYDRKGVTSGHAKNIAITNFRKSKLRFLELKNNYYRWLKKETRHKVNQIRTSAAAALRNRQLKHLQTP